MVKALHQGVLIPEALALLAPQADKWYVDGTFGRGGHTQAVLETGAKVIALDCDETAIAYGQSKFVPQITQGKLKLVRSNFAKLSYLLDQQSIKPTEVGGYLFDFGTSVDQIKAEKRGFSFENSQDPLDMRMDDRLGVKASDLVKLLTARELAEVLRIYGGEDRAWRIAKLVEHAKKTNPELLETVGGLVSIIENAKPRKNSHLHVATKTFQALRIVVNDELTAITDLVGQLPKLAASGAVVVFISFHDGEDRIIKHQLTSWENQGLGEKLTKKPITPSETEVKSNIRSRSAKLRGFKFIRN
ncbi:MAG: Ribosomal RNA small subunit methyltransferase H [candidate division WS6 bacterium GW2011_GWA2_37_6]|uniref:Ribosomal RNA small subunit methyltransferase H n=1 Tax=candidate division WS6 bacterium GW2011_GWA2_37_6 TaxID=1619087 RepID=A0A0G0K6E4_9BACT|nr:MAG: Ribosomal RNA small subunit methyltransferase H [candidate division WS6 bacterium GW2011_GWA2_37_6]